MSMPEDREGADLGEDQDTPRDDVTEGGAEPGEGDIGDARAEDLADEEDDSP